MSVPARTRELTPKQDAVLTLLLDRPADDIVSICKEAGYAVQNRGQALKVLHSLQGEISERFEAYLMLHGMEAMQELIGLMRDPSQPGAALKKQAIDGILDRFGLIKKNTMEVNHQGEVNHNVFIIPEKEILDLNAVEYEVSYKDTPASEA